MATTRREVKGLAELGRAMRALGADMESKIAFGAVLAGAKAIQRKAVANAPRSEKTSVIDGVRVEPGNLAKNIITKRVPKSQRQMTAEYVVAVRGKVKGKFASRYGAVEEFGSVERGPTPYMRPAYESSKGEAADKIVEILGKRIAKANSGGKS